jgi:hypothetical protein
LADRSKDKGRRPKPTPLLLKLRRSLPYQSHDQKKNNCAHGCCDDRGKNATATVQPKARQQRGRDERAKNANKNVAKQTEACPLKQLACQPAGDGTNNRGDEQSGDHVYVISHRQDMCEFQQH